MGIKVKARQTKLSVGPSKGEYRFIMQAEIYSTLKQEKVISEASIRSGIPKGSLQAAWEAIGEVVKGIDFASAPVLNREKHKITV